MTTRKHAVPMALATVAAAAMALPQAAISQRQQPDVVDRASSGAFVTRQGADLYVNGQVMRFAGSNMSWLGLLEDNSGSGTGVHYPSHAEIDSAMNDAETMGANVARTFGALSVGCTLCIQPSRGVFNDGTNGRPNGFDSLDYAIASARQRNIRLIMPLVDNYTFYIGGKFTYLSWRGIAADPVGSQFFTNATVRQDFKNHIAKVLNHVNPYTGNAYRNEPAILAWETGNELSVYPNAWSYSGWTGDIAAYIKSIDGNHLVGDGKYGIYSLDSTVDVSSLQLSMVDIYSNHAFDDYRTPSEVVYESNVVRSYGKVFFLGEFTWTGKDVGGQKLSWTLAQMLSSIQQNNVTGDLFWQLFPGGVNHGDGFTLHYPGDTATMRNRAQQLKNHAFVMCLHGRM